MLNCVDKEIGKIFFNLADDGWSLARVPPAWTRIRDQDAEIKRVVKNAKDEDKRSEVVEYLLKKDPSRYAWAESYLKKPQNKRKWLLLPCLMSCLVFAIAPNTCSYS